MIENLRQHLLNRLGTDVEELDVVLSHFKPVKAKRSELLLREGNVCRSVYFITNGCLQVYVIGSIAMQGKLVHTAPIEYNASLVTNHGVSSGPHKEEGSVLVSGYLICKADSHSEAEEWSKSCPILKYPQSSVEIRPIIPFPTN